MGEGGREVVLTDWDTCFHITKMAGGGVRGMKFSQLIVHVHLFLLTLENIKPNIKPNMNQY